MKSLEKIRFYIYSHTVSEYHVHHVGIGSQNEGITSLFHMARVGYTYTYSPQTSPLDKSTCLLQLILNITIPIDKLKITFVINQNESEENSTRS